MTEDRVPLGQALLMGFGVLFLVLVSPASFVATHFALMLPWNR